MIMVDQNQCIVTFTIMEFIHKCLLTCLGLESKQAIMGKVLAKNTLTPIMLDGFLLSKVAISTKELVVGMCISLMETKRSTSTAKLATKQCVFIVAMSVGASYAKSLAKVFGVYHRNVFATIQCQFLMFHNILPLWKLNVKNKRSYCILPITKVVLKWWALNE
jgi:hypothetical protein